MLFHLERLFRPLDGEQVKGQVLHLLQLHRKVPWEGRVVLVVEEWTKVSQKEQSLRNADRGNWGKQKHHPSKSHRRTTLLPLSKWQPDFAPAGK
eukprot:g26336.t1